MKRPALLVLGPHLAAVSGVSTHLNLLFSSRLAKEFSLVHFQVGSEGRSESGLGRLARLVVSPVSLAIAIFQHGATAVHLNTSLNARAYWRDLAYLIVARILGVRVLYQVHGGALPQQFFPANRILAAFLRWTLRLPDAVIVLARSEFDAYRRFIPDQQVLAIPNGIDCTSYVGIPRVWSDATAPLRLLYIGRLAKGKGLCELLQALKLAHAQDAKVRLIIAGGGPEEGRLRHLVDELGLSGDVSFAGPVFGESKIRLLADSDALVLASYSEGLPYALLESMAAGAPVIVTPVGAIPDVVTNGVHGLLVPPRDPVAIFRAIGKLHSDRGALARMSMACRKRVAGGYTLERLSGEFSRLYSQVCSVKHMNPLTRP